MSPEIFVRFVEPGFHCWPDAPPHRAYLRDAHRHLFHVEVRTKVWHDNREIEFHDLLDSARSAWRERCTTPLAASCEMKARAIAERLHEATSRSYTVTVSEDGECGATISWP